MEILNNNQQLVVHKVENDQHEQRASTEKPFIISNTEAASILDLQVKHIIPVYLKDNEPLISHLDFIEAAWQVSAHVYGDGNVTPPSIRVSHPIKGRIPEARNKPAAELLDHEKTIYYERMAFILEIPCNSLILDGNTLSLTVGGVKAYNLDNLHCKKGGHEHFKVFVGFKNMVCTNLCVSTDGLLADLKVTSLLELQQKIYDLLCRYNARDHFCQLQKLPEYELTEHQFAQVVGKSRLYNYLQPKDKKEIAPLLFGDQQISTICKDYYKDVSFCRSRDGSINLWNLYNLFTGANKSSYIDSFLEKGSSAQQFVLGLKDALDGKSHSWFLS